MIIVLFTHSNLLDLVPLVGVAAEFAFKLD